MKEIEYMANCRSDGNNKFQKRPFSILVKKDRELSDIRREYASKSKSERREAADWEYHSDVANDFFNNALAKTDAEGFGQLLSFHLP